jgi:hypothetical protein
VSAVASGRANPKPCPSHGDEGDGDDDDAAEAPDAPEMADTEERVPGPPAHAGVHRRSGSAEQDARSHPGRGAAASGGRAGGHGPRG